MSETAGRQEPRVGRGRRGVKRSVWSLMGVALIALVLEVPLAMSADTKDQGRSATALRTAEGLHFQLPDDWPVEKRGGVVGPIPVEEYLGRKFSAVESRLQQLEKQVSALELQVRLLEEQLSKAQRLQSGVSAPASPAGATGAGAGGATTGSAP